MSAALSGYVYFDRSFKFHDNTTGEKLLVVLCDSTLCDDLILVARTTSTPISELTCGCYHDCHPPCFCLPYSINNFDKDTWIVLDEVFEMERDKLEAMARTTDLSIEHTIGLLMCGSESMYLAGWQKAALLDQANTLS